VGVHQDGLVHISALADRFVKDPHDIVKAGDIVKVKVLEVDAERKRIGLSMRLGDEAPRAGGAGQGATAKTRAGNQEHGKRQLGRDDGRRGRRKGQEREQRPQGAMADAFSRAMNKSSD